MKHRISLIVATKHRPGDLRTLLESLRRQTVGPAEIVIVDARREPIGFVNVESLSPSMGNLTYWSGCALGFKQEAAVRR